MGHAYVLESIVGAFVGLLVLLFGAMTFRRRTIERGGTLIVGAIRPDAQARWVAGYARVGGDELEWFGIGGVFTRPKHVWPRHDLEFGPPTRLPGGERIAEVPDAWQVTGSRLSDGAQWQLAMSMPAYTAVRSWLESSPPGRRVNVA